MNIRRPSLIVIVVSFLLSLSAAAQQKTTLAIVGGRLIDGWGGTPLERSVILISGDRITAVGRSGELAVPSGVRIIDASGMTVMPGLIDMHIHLGNVGHTDLHYPGVLSRQGRTREVMLGNAKALLHSGVTTARDVGSPLDDAIETRERIKRGEIEGPRLFVSGPVLMKEFPPEDSPDHWKVENEEDARAKVRQLVSKGVDLIKVRDLDKMTHAERTAIVEEAHKAGKHVATHGIYPAEMKAVLDAGMDRRDTLEHTGLIGDGPTLDPELLRNVIERGLHIVPTIIVIETFSQMENYPAWKDNHDWKASLPPDIWTQVRQSLDQYQKIWFYRLSKYDWNHRRSRLKQILKAGGQLVMGSDSGARANPHTDAAWREVQLMEEIGMSPMEAIMASTRVPAEILGVANLIGTIEAGKKADILVIDGDPLQSAVFLRHPSHVVKDGVIFK
jgi:imidazolonepropionase-like amidohydrolase